MKVKTESVIEGAVLFAESELVPALDGWHVWAAAAAIALLAQRAPAAMDLLLQHKAVSAIGLKDADGLLDVSSAAQALKAAIKKHGKLEVDIPILGAFKFTEKDVDKLTGCIAQAAGVKEDE